MAENPHPILLNREKPAAQVAAHFSKQVALMEDVANYGSNLVVRAFESSPKQMADAIVCGTLLPKIVMMVDAVHVLFAAGCVHAALLPARAGFEASLYVDYILLADSEKRAMRYLVANYRRDRLWDQRVIPGTKQQVAYKGLPDSLGVDFQALHPELAQHAASHLAEVNRVLGQPALAEIDKEFDAAKRKYGRERDWYAVDGRTPNIRSVAEQVGRLADYQIFYETGSKVTHTSTYKDQMMFWDGAVRLKPVRNLLDSSILINTIFTAAFGAYDKVLRRTRPDELPAFGKKYVEDWRDAFLNIPNIDFDFTPKD